MFQKDNFSIVDIGSNSIRLFYVKNGQITKDLITTRLTEEFDKDRNLKDLQMERTVAGLLSFAKTLDRENIQTRHYFATAGVRHAKNKDVFLEKLSLHGINAKILSKSEEALAGFLGATVGKCGSFGVIDIGGGSTEIAMGNLRFLKESPTHSADLSHCDTLTSHISQRDTCVRGESQGGTPSTSFASGFEDFDTKLAYSYGGKSLSLISNSFEIGAVRFSERTKENEKVMEEEFGKIFQLPCCNDSDFDFYAIGGTATAVGGLVLGMSEFDEILEGKTITKDEVEKCLDSLRGKTREEIVAMGVSEKRAGIIFSGTFLLSRILNSLNLKEFKLTHLGNLEGFAVMNSLI